MGGKKQPRTKNNVQPSSSDRHAQRLGTEPLIGFSALADLGYVPAAMGGAPDDAAAGGVAVSGQLRALLKKMEKKDAITKSKAVQEFAELCETHDLNDVKAALPFWPRLYRKLATDVDNRVRELSHVALQRLLARVRRAATPHMAQLVPTWLCSQSDPYPPAASAARRAFQSTFPVADKQTGVAKFCFDSILSHIKEGLYDLTPQTYSDASVMTADELEARYVRLLTGCLAALRELTELLSPPGPDGAGEDPSSSADSADSEQPLADIVTNNKFCKLAKHGHPQVRRWWFSLVSRLCARRSRLVVSAAARLAPAALHGLHEQDPAVLTDAWDAAISLASTVPDCWSHVSLRKAVLPQLWVVLREGGRGCAVTLHPLMIILLSKLPADVAGGDQPEFHRLFFSSLYQGLSVDRVLQSRREVSVICRTIWECALYVLRSRQCSEQVIDVIVEQLCTLTSAMVTGPLVRVAPHVLPALSAGLNSLYSVAAADGAGAAAAGQRAYWTAVESVVLRQHLSSDDRTAAAATIDLLMSVASTAPEPPSEGRTRVTFSDPAPGGETVSAAPAPAAAAAQRLSPLALAADSPLQQCAARAGQRLMDAVRAASAGPGQRRQLVRLLVGVPGVAERVAAGPAEGGGPGRQLYDVLMEPELAAGGCELSSQMLPTVCRLCDPQQRSELAQHVTKKGYLSVVAELLELSATDGHMRAWAASDELQAAVLAAVRSAPSAGSAAWRHALRTVPALLRCHADLPDSDPAAALLSAVTEPAAGGWRLEQLASLLAPSCRSAGVLLRAHWSALSGSSGSGAALAALQSRLATLGGDDTDAALADQLRAALVAGPATTGQRRLRAATLAWAQLLGADRFCPLLDALLPAGWEKDDRRPRAQLCLLLRRRVSLQAPVPAAPAPAAAAPGGGTADHLRLLLVELLAEWSTEETDRSAVTVRAAVARYLPDLLAAHVVADAASESAGRGDRAPLQTAESQLTQLVMSLSAEQLTTLRRTVTDRAVVAKDGVDAAALALLLQLSETDKASLVDTLQDNVQLLLPCIPLLSDGALLSLVTSAADGAQLCRLAGSAAALRQMSSRHGDDWTISEAGSTVISTLDAVVRARDAGQLPCSWEEADRDWQQLAQNVAALRFFAALLDHCCCLLEPTHWDVLLLSVSSWVAGLQESSETACLPAGPGVGAPVLLHTLCFTVEAVRTAVARCADQNRALAAEWEELYAPEWYRALLSVFVTLATTGDAVGPAASPLMAETLTAVSSAMLHSPAAALLHHALPARLDGQLDESHLSADTITLVSWWRRLLTAHSRCVRLAAWQTMHRFLPHLAEAEQTRPHEEDDRDDPKLALPTLFRLITGQTEPLVSALLSELTAGQTCLVDPRRESHHVVLTHLMTWHLALSFSGHQDTQRKVMTAEALRQDGTLDVLLNQLFRLMPETPEVPESYADTNKTFFELEPLFDLTGGGSAEEVQHWACRTYAEVLRQLPVLARAWRSGCERSLALRVERLTSEYVSPLLLTEEFLRLQTADTTIDNMTVRARPSVREVSAVYTMEEASTELVVRLPADYPLGHVVADAAGRRVGVAAGQWRMWMMQLTTFLTHQNGSVLDGLLLWKQNIDKRFQGVEECNICFYVLHGTNYQLPKLACRNCKKRFHPACLYKWFNTSSKSTCPMCRQLF